MGSPQEEEEEEDSPEDRAAAAEKFLAGRKIKVSEGGPRVNEEASTDTLSQDTVPTHSRSEMESYELPPVTMLKAGQGTVAAPAASAGAPLQRTEDCNLMTR